MQRPIRRRVEGTMPISRQSVNAQSGSCRPSLAEPTRPRPFPARKGDRRMWPQLGDNRAAGLVADLAVTAL